MHQSRHQIDGEFIATGALLSVVAVIGLATFRDYGIATDEFNMNVQGAKFLAWFTSGFTDTSWLNDVDAKFYGAWFDTLIAYVQSLQDAAPFDVRHGITFLVSLAGLATVVPLGRLAMGRWAGFTAIALCLSTGYFYGQMFFSPVDMPFMATMNWALLAILLMARRPVPSWPATICAGLLTGLAIGTRIGGVLSQVYLVAAMLLTGLDVILRQGRAGADMLARIAARSIAAIIIGWAVALAIWPWLQGSNPLARLAAAFKFFSRIYLDFPFRHWGREVHSLSLPWDYVPEQFLARLSEAFLLMLGLAAIFGAVWLLRFAWACVRRARLHGTQGLRAPALLLTRSRGLLIVTMAAVVPFLIILVTRPTLYDGFRHLIFVVPLLALLAGWALHRLLPLLRRFPMVFAILGGVQLGVAVVTMATLHPLEYIATNSFAGRTQGSYGRFDLDYWSEAATVAVRRLEQRLDYKFGRDATAPHILVCIPWREYLVQPMFRRPWIVETDPQKADFIIETERAACAHGAGTVIDEVKRYDRVFARTIDMGQR